MMKKFFKFCSAALSSAILLSASVAGGTSVMAATGEEIELVPSKSINIKVGTPAEYLRMMKELVKDSNETKKITNAIKNYSSSVDNSKDGYFPVIKTQGSVGSCGAWSGVYYTYTHEMNYHLKKKTTEETTFNPLFIYNLNAGGFINNHGIFPYKAFEYIGSNGCITCKTNPDVNQDYKTWNPTFEAWREANDYRLSACFWFEDLGAAWNKITSADDSDLDAIKAMLRSGHVTSFCGHIYSYDMQKLKASSEPNVNKDVVGEKVITSRNGNSGYHAMTIVGYNDNIWTDLNNNNKIDKGEMGAFKIANSWAESWGNKGFCWLAYDALNKVSVVEGVEYKSTRGSAVDQICMPVISKNFKSSNIYLKYTLNSNNRKDSYLIIKATKKSDGTTYKRKSLPQFVSFGQSFSNNLNYEGKEGYGDGTFIVDLDNLVPDLDSNNFNDYKWSVSFVDGQDGAPLTIKEAVIIDENTGKRYNFNATLPVSINGQTKNLDMMPCYNISRLAYSPKTNVVVNKAVNISFTCENEVRYNDKLKYQIDITRDGKNVYSKQTKAAKVDRAARTATVALKWTPSKIGTYTVTATAIDATGAVAKRSTTIKVFSSKLVFRSLSVESDNEIGGTFLFNYETIKITPKVTGGKGTFTYSYYFIRNGKTYKLAENTKKTSWTKTFNSKTGEYTFLVKAKDESGKTVSMSKKIIVGRTRIRGLDYSIPNAVAKQNITISSKFYNMPDIVNNKATFRFIVTNPNGVPTTISQTNTKVANWKPEVNGIYKIKLEVVYEGKVLSTCTDEYIVGQSGQQQQQKIIEDTNNYIVKVNVISYILNEYNNNTSNFKVHYWNDGGFTGDASLVALNTTVNKNVGFWGSAQTFKQYTVKIPKTATGYKFHIGDRWFGANGSLSSSNSVYIFNYSGDKATYCKE